MKTFIKIDNKLVNLQNIASVNVLNNRIIFNMNYYIEIEHKGVYKNVSDYVYYDVEDVVKGMNYISEFEYFKDNFFTYGSVSVNKNCISSVKFADNKNRIIVNLSHSVSFIDFNNEYSITSEFAYLNCASQSEYESVKQRLIAELGV